MNNKKERTVLTWWYTSTWFSFPAFHFTKTHNAGANGLLHKLKWSLFRFLIYMKFYCTFSLLHQFAPTFYFVDQRINLVFHNL